MLKEVEGSINRLEKLYYSITKKMIEKYDYLKTKENVEFLIEEYKIAKFQYLVSDSSLQQITSCYNFKHAQKTMNKNDRLGDEIAKRIDSKNMVDSVDAIFKSILKIIPLTERKYCIFCLINNHSERMLMEDLGITKRHLEHIKENCILKIALAFHIEVLR